MMTDDPDSLSGAKNHLRYCPSLTCSSQSTTLDDRRGGALVETHIAGA
jgi:hypothetical protein